MPIIVPSTAKCSYCEKDCDKLKTRTMRHKRFVYTDGAGREWFRKICPNCTSKYNRDKKRDNASRVKEAQVLFMPNTRKCRSCGASTVNYFKCKECVSHNQAAYYMEAMGGVAY